MKKLITTLIFLFGVPLSLIAQNPPVPHDFNGCPEYTSFLKYAQIFADTLLRAGVDHFGPKNTPVFLQMLSLKTHRPPTQENNPYWQKHYGDDFAVTARGSNLARETYLLPALWQLSEITGNPKYRQAVEAYLKFFFANCVNPKTHLWAWGEHMNYDCFREQIFHHRQEMELATPPWELFWQIDSVAVLNEIESFFEYHTYDKEDTFLFDRHANYYTGGFDDIAVRGAYIKHSGIYLHGFAFLWRKTGNPKYLVWMKKEAELFRRSQHPQTGLLPDAAFGGGLSSQTPMLAYYVLLAYQQDRSQIFLLDYAESYLQNFLKAISDPESDHFFAAVFFETGTPATSANLDFWTRNSLGAYLGKTAVLLYRETQNPKYLEYARKLARSLESQTYHRESGPGAFGQVLHFLLDLYEATGEISFLENSRRYAATAIDSLFTDGLFKDKIDSYIYNAGYPNDGDHTGHLFLMLLRLYEIEKTLPAHWQAPTNWTDLADPIPVEVFFSKKITQTRIKFQRKPKTKAEFILPEKTNGTVAEFLIPGAAEFQGEIEFRIEVKTGKNWIDLTREIGTGKIFARRCATGPKVTVWNYPPIAATTESIPVQFVLQDSCGLKQAKLGYLYPGEEPREQLITTPLKSGEKIQMTLPPALLGNAGKLRFHVCAWGNPEFPLASRSVEQSILISSKYVQPVPGQAEPQQISFKKSGIQLTLNTRKSLEVILEMLPESPVQSTEGLPAAGLLFFNLKIDGKIEKTATFPQISVPVPEKWRELFLEKSLALYHWDGKFWQKFAGEFSSLENSVRGNLTEWGLFTVSGESREVWRKAVDQPVLSAPVVANLVGDAVLETVFSSRDFGLATYAYQADGQRLWETSAGGGYSFPKLSDLDGDGKPEIISGNSDRNLYVLNADGSEKWHFAADSLVKTPAVGDLDGDGIPEVVIGTLSGEVCAISNTGTLVWKYQTDGPRTIPVLADLEGDGKMETIIAGRDEKLWVFDFQGKLRWKLSLKGRQDYSPAVGDLDGDGKQEILLNNRTPEHAGMVYAISWDGKMLWSVPCDGEGDWAVVLGDVNQDGRLEVIANDVKAALNIINFSGKIVQQIPLESWNTLTPALVDLTGDGKLDFIVAGNEDRKVHAYENSGKRLWSFQPPSPTYGGAKVKGGANPAVADVDGDGFLNILFGDDECWFYNLRTDVPCQPYEIKVNQYHNNEANTGVYEQIRLHQKK